MFNDIKEASSFWKSLWKGIRTGNKKAAWLDELRAVIKKQVPTPIEEVYETRHKLHGQRFMHGRKTGVQLDRTVSSVFGGNVLTPYVRAQYHPFKQSAWFS